MCNNNPVGMFEGVLPSPNKMINTELFGFFQAN